MARSNEGCKRTFLVILCIVLGLLLTLLIAGTVYANHVLSKVNRFARRKMLLFSIFSYCASHTNFREVPIPVVREYQSTIISGTA